MIKSPQTHDMSEFVALAEHYRVLLQEIKKNAALLHRVEQRRNVAPDKAEGRQAAVERTPLSKRSSRERTVEKINQEVMMKSKEKMAVEGEKQRETVLERVMRQREQHQKRSIFVRAGAIVAGGAVSIFAVPLLLAPELGLPLLLFGLRLLALEFDWAARLYARVEKLARRVLGGLKRLYKSMFKSKSRIAVTVVILAVWTVAVWTLVL